jgi:hypothetical protein
MKRTDIVRLLSEFEVSHPVETWKAYDWHVWPLLRLSTGWHLYNSKADTKRKIEPRRDESTLGEKLKERMARVKRYICSVRADARALKTDTDMHVRPDRPEHPVVILTVSNRRILRGGRWYDIFSDPLSERLDSRGVKYSTWELGMPNTPRYRPSALISTQLDRALASGRYREPLAKPEWFDTFAPWAEEYMPGFARWEDLRHSLETFHSTSKIYEDWMRRGKAQLMIAVCWYSLRVMAASVACRRAGVISVDLQHGLQDAGHYSYSGWDASPEGGYEMMPHYFWAWGRDNVHFLEECNGAFRKYSRVRAGGNLWLNMWRNKSSNVFIDESERVAQGTKSFRKRIVVTLQSTILDFDYLVRAISESPADWCWLVRLHPMMREKTVELKRLFESTGHAGVCFDLANDAPLYALLRNADVHATSYSTSAMEALAFGVPTVITHENGLEAYGRYIEDGVMRYGGGSESIVEAIRNCEKTERSACSSAASGLFASENESEEFLSELLGSAGISS